MNASRLKLQKIKKPENFADVPPFCSSPLALPAGALFCAQVQLFDLLDPPYFISLLSEQKREIDFCDEFNFYSLNQCTLKLGFYWGNFRVL